VTGSFRGRQDVRGLLLICLKPALPDRKAENSLKLVSPVSRKFYRTLRRARPPDGHWLCFTIDLRVWIAFSGVPPDTEFPENG